MARNVGRSVGGDPRVAVVRFQDKTEDLLQREVAALLSAGANVDVLCLGSVAETVVVEHRATNGRAVQCWTRTIKLTKPRGSVVAYAWQYLRWLAWCTWQLASRGTIRPYTTVQVSTLPDHQILAAVIPKLRGSRVVLSFKEPAAELFETMMGRAAGVAVRQTTKLAWRLADHCLCVTEAHRRTYLALGIPPERITVVGNGPDEGSWPDVEPEEISPDKVVAVCHGSIEERWGHETIVRALAVARRSLPQLRVVFTGHGAFADEIAKLAEREGVDDILEMRGWVTRHELTALLRRADIGVVAQLASPYSNLVHTGKMYDYFSLGVAVVASDLEATREDCVDCCAFYPSGDAAGLAAALCFLGRSPQERSAFVAAASTRLAEIGWEAQRSHYLNVLLPGNAAAVSGADRE